MQAILSPGRERAMDERDLDEEVDAFGETRLDKRRRGEFEDAQLEFEREPVAHLAFGLLGEVRASGQKTEGATSRRPLRRVWKDARNVLGWAR